MLSRFTTIRTAQETVQIYSRETGSGPPLLLLHGLGANLHTWRLLVRNFSQHFRVIMIDLKGCGRSDKPANSWYSLDDHGQIVAGFIKARALKDVTLIGNSMGGGIALAICVRNFYDINKSIKNLILLDTIAYPQTIPYYLGVLRKPRIGELILNSLPVPYIVRLVLNNAFFTPAKIRQTSIQAFIRPLKQKAAKFALLQTVRQIIPPDIDELVRKYRDIHHPALIIWGRQDTVVPLAIGEQLGHALPDNRFHVLDECGHMPQEEKPAETLALVNDFLTINA